MKPIAMAMALVLAAPLAFTACSKKSDSPGPGASSAPAAATVASCPPGSTSDGTNCKGSGPARVAALAWNKNIGDTAQVLTVRNFTAIPLKAATVSVWFYDSTGKRLDTTGAKKYMVPGDAFGTVLRGMQQRELTIPLGKSNLPDGTAQIEAEVVKVTLVNPDGSDGMSWKNDDLNQDERVMAGTAAAPPVVTRPMGTLPVRPGRRPTPPPAPLHH